MHLIEGVHWVVVNPFLLLLLLPLRSQPDVRISILQFSPLIFAPMKSDKQGSPSEADESKADEKSQHENRAGDSDGNCLLSRTFYSGLTHILYVGRLSAEIMLILLNTYIHVSVCVLWA